MINIASYKEVVPWKESTSGRIAQFEKGGKRYFFKEYRSPVCPSRKQVEDGVLTEKSYQKHLEKFEKFSALRSEVNSRLNAIASEGGNIICARDWGVIGGRFVEATEFAPGLLEEDEVIRLSDKDKIMILLTAVGALVTIHSKNIIHGDLKFSNIAVVRNDMGLYVGKLIDFDSSILYDQKPRAVGGDQVYMSPEIGHCWKTEMSPKSIEAVDFKADIFSLGVLFHKYITGELPVISKIPEGLEGIPKDKLYYWEYIRCGGEPAVNERKIKSAPLAALIKDMLNLDPARRPDARETLRRLKEARDGKTATPPPPPREEKPKVVVKTFEEPWPEHGIAYDEAAMARMMYVGASRCDVLGKKAYALNRADGSVKKYTKEQLIAAGLAKAGAAGAVGGGVTPPPARKDEPKVVAKAFEEPWPEHGIEFVESAIERMMYVSVAKCEVFGKKAYAFSRADGTVKKYTKEQLVSAGLAKTK